MLDKNINDINDINDINEDHKNILPAPATVSTEVWQCHTREMEARRLLAQLDHASVDDLVCEDTDIKIASSMHDKPWRMCDKDSTSVMKFIVEQRDKWANGGYVIIIEAGQKERERRRILNFLIYQAILSKFKNYNYIARIYDWQAILNDLSQYKNPSRPIYIESMSRISVLGINEFNLLLAPKFRHDLDVILTSILRKRKISGMPTIITLSKPSWDVIDKGGDNYGTQIVELLQTAHDEEIDKIIRIRVGGGSIGWEKVGD